MVLQLFGLEFFNMDCTLSNQVLHSSCIHNSKASLFTEMMKQFQLLLVQKYIVLCCFFEYPCDFFCQANSFLRVMAYGPVSFP